MLRLTALVATLAVSTLTLASNSPRWIYIRGGTWEPQALPFAEIEDSLRPLVVAAAEGRGPVYNWITYRFQYQGRRTALGQRYVYINAYCEAGGEPRSVATWVVIADGGACYFQAKYDPATKRLFDVRVNGVA